VLLYHELLLTAAALMEVTLPEPLADSKELRTTLRDMFRNAHGLDSTHCLQTGRDSSQ
jgi:hypothetical protein